MNEVGLSADAATELGRLLDAGPSVWQHAPETFMPAAPPRRGPAGPVGPAGPASHRIPAAAAAQPPPDWPLPGRAAAPPRPAAAQYPLWSEGVRPGGGCAGLDQRGGLAFAIPQEVVSGRTM